MLLDLAQAGFRLLHLLNEFFSDIANQLSAAASAAVHCRWSEMDVQPRMLLDLAQAGFRLLHLPDEFTRVWWDGRSITAAIPKLREVTEQNLKYDLWDAETFRWGQRTMLGAAFAQEWVPAAFVVYILCGFRRMTASVCSCL
jgi:hypothetical protein